VSDFVRAAAGFDASPRVAVYRALGTDAHGQPKLYQGSRLPFQRSGLLDGRAERIECLENLGKALLKLDITRGQFIRWRGR
jgi:hypothetical protein